MREIGPLLEKYLQIVDSEWNRENKKYWDNAGEPYLAERWRGRSLRRENAPFTMALDISGYSRVLGFNCADYYSDPAEQLYHQLRYAIWEFENLRCHRYFDRTVFISFGSVFGASFFGVPIHYLPAQAPWYDEKEHVLSSKADLLKIKPFNFFSTGLCAQAHRFYEAMVSMTEGYDIRVMFPVTLRSPFSIALMLRGFSDLMLDTYDDPSFFHDLMALITGVLKQYAAQRAQFLKEPIAPMKLFNDEIGAPMVSAKLYEERIFPFEKELAGFSGGISYWHSCGDTGGLYESVGALPGLQMMHIGPWSDVGKAAEVFGHRDIALEICVNSVADVYERSEEEMRRKLLSIRQACDGKVRYQVRADGFAVLHSMDFTLEKIRMWNRAAMDVFPGC